MTNSQPTLVFTDLDGTLLNHHDYDWSAARPALAELRARRIPLILVSSKTDVEMLSLRHELDNHDPLVCENGSLVLVPEPLLEPLGMNADPRCINGSYYYDYRGVSREQILQILNGLTGDYDFTGFAWMSTDEVVEHTGLAPEAAELASRRKASEPLVWQDSAEALAEFRERLQACHLRLLKGGRFYHVMGQCDKGDAVRTLSERYQHWWDTRPHTIALGDSPNDLDMLKQVDVPIIIPHQDGQHLQDSALKGAIVAPKPGAEGWSQALLDLINSQ